MLYAGWDLSRKRLDFRLLDRRARRSRSALPPRTPTVFAGSPLCIDRFAEPVLQLAALRPACSGMEQLLEQVSGKSSDFVAYGGITLVGFRGIVRSS
jgi:hypothetical protein